MPRRLLTLAALVLAGLVGAGGCADKVAPAARVGDVTITHDDLMAEVEEWAGNDATRRAVSLPVGPSTFAMDEVSSVLGERIILVLFGTEFDRQGLELTEEMRAQGLAAIGIDPSQEEAVMGGFSEEFRQAYIDDYAKAVALQSALGDDAFLEYINDAAKDVEVSSRYGTWDPADFVVTPPPATVEPRDE